MTPSALFHVLVAFFHGYNKLFNKSLFRMDGLRGRIVLQGRKGMAVGA